PERVDEDLEVVGPLTHRPVEVRRRGTDTRPVDADQAQAVPLREHTRLDGDLTSGAGRPVQPDGRGPLAHPVLGEAEAAATGDGDGPLELRALQAAHGRSSWQHAGCRAPIWPKAPPAGSAAP